MENFMIEFYLKKEYAPTVNILTLNGRIYRSKKNPNNWCYLKIALIIRDFMDRKGVNIFLNQ